MELSTKSEYALLALLELVSHYPTGEPLQIRQIAAEQSIPDRYLEQLLAILRRSGLVRSQRGARGGYLLAREPWKITLLEILNCVEGLDAKASPCAKKFPAEVVIHDAWQEARQAAEAVLQSYSLQDLAEQRDAKRQLNFMYYI